MWVFKNFIFAFLIYILGRQFAAVPVRHPAFQVLLFNIPPSRRGLQFSSFPDIRQAA